MPLKDYREYRTELSKKSSVAEKLDYISSTKNSNEVKNILANNVSARKEKIDMVEYKKYGDYDTWKFALESPKKYKVISNFNIKYNDYSKYEEKINEIKKTYSGTRNAEVRKKKIQQYINTLPYNSTQKTALYNLLGGYSIKGNKKQMIKYINNLKLSAKEKQQIYDVFYK